MDKIIKNIELLYKEGSFTHTLFEYVKPNFWIEKLGEYFPTRFDNLTDFNYSKCFWLRVNISETNASVTEKEFDDYIEENQEIYILEMELSVILPYVTYKFIKYTINNGKLQMQYSTTPFLEEHATYVIKFNKFITDIGYVLLDDKILGTIVPDVSLELREKEPTVYNCLFQDTYSGYSFSSGVTRKTSDHLKKVLEDIKMFYKYGETSYALTHYVDQDAWNEKLGMYFDKRSLCNLTNFQIHKCFTFWVNLSSESITLSNLEIEKYIEENSIIYCLEIKISAVNSYVQCLFYKFSYKDGQIVRESNRKPFHKEQLLYICRIEKFVNEIGYTVLNDEILTKPIPTIFIKGCKEHTTVNTWLFGD